MWKHCCPYLLIFNYYGLYINCEFWNSIHIFFLWILTSRININCGLDNVMILENKLWRLDPVEEVRDTESDENYYYKQN